MSRQLQAIQSDFQSYVLDAAGATSALAAGIAAQHGLPAERRLAIYHDAYRIRLRSALAEAYPKTRAYLGDELFAEAGAGYLESNPSQHRNLRWYGERFAEYLTQALPAYPVVAELAAFEWALGLAFDAADADVLTMEQVRALAPEQWQSLGFELQPSLQFLTLQSNAAAIWLALEHEQTPPGAAMSMQAIPWLVWRKDLQPHFRSLDEHEARALQELRQGATFSTVCEAAVADAEHDISPRIAGWLQSWLSEGVLANIK